MKIDTSHEWYPYYQEVCEVSFRGMGFTDASDILEDVLETYPEILDDSELHDAVKVWCKEQFDINAYLEEEMESVDFYNMTQEEIVEFFSNLSEVSDET